MNPYFLAAAALSLLVGLIHSVLGEVMIFQRLRHGGLIPTQGGGLLRESNVRILWASWHVLTVLGLCIAAVLVWLSLPSSQVAADAFVARAIALAMLAGAGLVFVGTKGRHPGWVGLLGVAVLVGLGLRS